MFKNYFTFAALYLPFTVFTKEIGSVKVGTIDIDVLGYPFFVFSFVILFASRKLSISQKEAVVFSLILSIGIVNTLLFELPFKFFLKQLLPIVILYFVSKSIMTYRNPLYIFEKYVEYSIFAAILGIFQIILKQLVGIKFLTGYDDISIDSLALEPSHYVVMILPACIYFYEKEEFGWRFILLFLTLVLTFKLTALLAFLTYFFIRNIKRYREIALIMPLLLLASIYIVNSSTEFEKRISSALSFAETQDISTVDNLTSFSFLSNLIIAEENFVSTYGSGIGLGGHETTYLRNFDVGIVSDKWYGTNMKSAHSLLIRVISELGMLGIIIMIMLFYSSFQFRLNEYSIIAWASLSHFVAKFYKSGSYFDYGTIFFLVMIITMIKLDKRIRVNKVCINQ